MIVPVTLWRFRVVRVAIILVAALLDGVVAFLRGLTR